MTELRLSLDELENNIYNDIMNRRKSPDDEGILNLPETFIVSEAIVQLYYGGIPDTFDFKRRWISDRSTFGKKLYQKCFLLDDDIIKYLNELTEIHSGSKHQIIIFALVCFDTIGCMDETSMYMHCRKWIKAKDYRELTGEEIY